MKKVALVLLLCLLAAPAFAGVTVQCAQTPDTNEVVVSYEMDIGDANLPRAFAIDISVDSGATIGAIYGFDPNYHVSPGTYDYNEGTGDVNWGNPVVDLTASSFTVEMGSLYAATDPYGHTTPPAPNGVLLKFTVSGDCSVIIEENAARAGVDSNGVVMEDTEKTFPPEYVAISECQISVGPAYPPCWDYVSQCHADSDNNGQVSIGDLNALVWAWGTVYGEDPNYFPWDPQEPPDGKYNPCADFDRNGQISIGDLNELSSAGYWGTSWGEGDLPQDCPTLYPDPLGDWLAIQ